MKEGFTVAKDADGNPSLLADCRTPIADQERDLRLIKAGVKSPPEWVASIDLICSERGVISKWKAKSKPAPKIETKKGKQR